MSSILKALKKAEQESPGKAAWPILHPASPAPGFAHRKKKNLFYPRILALLVLITLVMGMAAAFLFFKDSPQKSPSPSLPPAKLPESPPKTDIKEEAHQIKPSEKPPGLKKESPEEPPTRQDTVQEIKPEPASAPMEKSTPVKKEPALLQDGALIIQAISWSKTPSDRVAVINNTVVSEGDTVQDYRILSIAPDEIILERSNRKFRLSFKYR